MHTCRGPISVALTAFACTLWVSSLAADQLKTPDIEQIQILKTRLFERTLTDERLAGLLDALSHSESQSAAAAQIRQLGTGCQKQILEFANSCRDIEVRERCADIISALDDAWRKSTEGRLFIDLCRKHAASVLPDAWKRFSEDGKDQAAGATILAAPADMVWKWIEDRHAGRSDRINIRSDGRHPETPIEIDRSRYLLLRIRDLSPDAFAASHVPAVRNLFRQKKHVFGGSAHRIAGHVQLKHFAAAMVTSPVARGAPRQDVFRFHSKRYLLFQFEDQAGSTSIRLGQSIAFDTVTYGPYSIDPQFQIIPLTAEQKAAPCFTIDTAFVRETLLGHRSSHLAPLLHLKPEHRDLRSLPDRLAPWWWKRYVSEFNAQRMVFTERKPDATAPAEKSEEPQLGIAPTGQTRAVVSPADDALSFVILPPRLLGAASEPDMVAAELACDRLAEELEVLAVQVVDRQHLQTILEEQSLGTMSRGALTGFDAMVRLEVANDRLQPESTVSVVDLSTGTTFATQKFAWPIPESDAEQLQRLLKTAVSNAEQPASQRLRIRFNGTRQPPQVRMRPFATKLTQAVNRTLRNDQRLVVVDHLEAGSAAEESLLMLMGLSRLPGGRTFQPTADVVLNLTLQEHDSVGKTFDNTILKVGYALKVPQQSEQFVTVNATVAEFESQLVPELIDSINQRLATIQPGTAIQDDASGSRQAQAVQELMAIASVDPALSRVDQSLARRHHAETALKLDPTSLHAVFELILAYQKYLEADSNAVDKGAIALQGLTLMAERMEEFAPYSGAMPQMLKAANLFTFHLHLDELQHQAEFDRAKSEEYLRITNAILKIAEAGLTGAPSEISSIIGDFLQRGFAGLKKAGTELSEIQPRLNTIIDHLERLQSEHADIIASQPGTPSDMQLVYRNRIQSHLRHIRRCALSVSCSMQLPKQFDRLLPVVQHDLSNVFSENVAWGLQADLKRLNDARRTAELEAWISKRRDQPVVSLISLAWPTIDLFADLPMTTVEISSQVNSEVVAGESVCPLAKTSNRLYFMTGKSPFVGWKVMAASGSIRRPSQKFGFVPLDQHGNPAGDAQFIAVPDSLANTLVGCCMTCDDRLVLGTSVVSANADEGGMYLLNPAGDLWTHLGVKQGLPARTVSSMHLLPDKRIFCTGMAGFGEYACFTFEPSSGEIRAYASGWTAQQQSIPDRLMGVYTHGNTVYGYSEHGCWRNLLSAEPSRMPAQYSQEWISSGDMIWDTNYLGGCRDACRINDHIYFINNNGLLKADLSGVVQRIWGSHRGGRPSFETELTSPLIALPRSPAPTGSYLVKCGDLLLLIAHDSESLVAFEPEHDRWYGPVQIPRSVYAVVDQQKVWLGGDSLHQLSVSEIKAAAKNCGRMMTTEEYRNRQRREIEKTTGLTRARLELTSGNFEAARTCLEQLQREDPQDFETHYLSGRIYATSILNQPDQAAAAYQRAAETARSPSEAFSSHYRHCLLLQQVGHTQAAAELAEMILNLYPRISGSRIRDFLVRLQQQ